MFFPLSLWKMNCWEILAKILLFVLPLYAAAAEKPAYLIALRIQPATTTSHFTFILTKKTKAQAKFLNHPDRVIVELQNTQKNFRLHNARLGSANVSMMSTEEDKNNTLRFIFYVKEKIKWSLHFLPEKNKNVYLQLDITTLPADKSQEDKAIKAAFEEDLLNTFSKEVAEPQKSDEFVVVIDAGHGGKDPGARGVNGILEKKVVLAIAKCLAKEINQIKNMRAILTRNGDYFVPLRQRLQFARKGNADLFIAIHADAYFNNYKTGASVFALSPRGATTEAARWLAQQQNYSELDNVELSSLKERSPFLRYMLIDLAQTATIRDSLRLGNRVLEALDEVSSLHYKHVEQAPFVVLKSPDIPSILIETGFITNPYEERRLANPVYQRQIARAIKQGIMQYRMSYLQN